MLAHYEISLVDSNLIENVKYLSMWTKVANIYHFRQKIHIFEFSTYILFTFTESIELVSSKNSPIHM